MSHAIESILVGGEDVEIIIVNDGSSDDTSKIAHEYEEKYPTIIKAVDKENGGHGDAVNSGLTHATGKYFKVVDSDDWVDAEALRKILEFLKKLEYEDEEAVSYTHLDVYKRQSYGRIVLTEVEYEKKSIVTGTCSAYGTYRLWDNRNRNEDKGKRSRQTGIKYRR